MRPEVSTLTGTFRVSPSLSTVASTVRDLSPESSGRESWTYSTPVPSKATILSPRFSPDEAFGPAAIESTTKGTARSNISGEFSTSPIIDWST